MKIDFAVSAAPRAGAIVALVADGKALSPTAQRLDRDSSGAVKRAISDSKFKGGKDQTLAIPAPRGVRASRILLVGIGKPDAYDAQAAFGTGSAIYAALANTGDNQALVAADPFPNMKADLAEVAAQIAFGAQLRSYRFDKYRTKQKPEDKPTLAALTVAVRNDRQARAAWAPLGKVAEAIFFARDLVTEPANVINPKTLADQARTLTKLGIKVEVLDRPKIEKLKMGALLGVAQGSANEPRVVAMRWDGDRRAKDKRPVAFVGKGVTFDTGGISIKPSASMEDMKWDMAGAGAVIGLMRSLAARKARVNAVGIVGLVENMPGSKAQRPGDVVRTMSGQTVEVINTDAEGRLVLGDVVWYAQKQFKPHTVIDLATLTGAIIIALGHEQAGLFANDEKLAEKLIAAGKASGENLWRMPLGEAYDKEINSDIADMKNVGSGRGAGSTAGAQFIKRFVQDGVAWAHLDIAGVAWSTKDRPGVPKGASAFGIRVLDRYVAENCEAKEK
jgi:leucyl aminopeptidase